MRWRLILLTASVAGNIDVRRSALNVPERAPIKASPIGCNFPRHGVTISAIDVPALKTQHRFEGVRTAVAGVKARVLFENTDKIDGGPKIIRNTW